PLYAKSLDGFPYTAIYVGDIDLFARESLDFEKRLISEHIRTSMHVYPGAYHIFDIINPDANVSVQLFLNLREDYNRAARIAATEQ
ncbi:MAG: hypothetical protein ACI4M9_04690, partial [Succinivibrio sp.]